MATQNDMLNLTLYFDYENNESGFNQIMSSLDKISAQATETMRSNSELFDEGEMEQSIQQYRKYIERIKEALETSWNPDTQSFDLTQAMDIDEEAFTRLRNGFGGVRTSIQETDDSIIESNAQFQNYGRTIDNFKLTLTNAFRYNIVNKFVDAISSEIQGVIYYIKDLDRALNNIRVVSGESAESMYDFADKANEAAKALGRTATEYAQAAQIYYQQGLKQEDVISRTNDTLLLANITGDSVANAADKLTAVMNGYQLATEDSTRALDVMAKLGADTATDFGEIAGAMQKVASQANSANLSLEQTTAMLATIMSITREAPETVGTSLKAIIARLNELKFASGEETSRVQKQFVNIGMSIFDANGQIKQTTVLFDEIADKFQTADDNTKKVIATAVAGAEQQNRFLTLMENWDTYNEYLDKAYNSSGSALEQNEIYMDSIEAKSKKLKSTIDSIKFDLFGDIDFGKAIDTVDTFATYTGKIVKDFGGLNQILIIAAGSMAKLFGVQTITLFQKEFGKIATYINDIKNGKTGLFDFSQGLPKIEEINKEFLAGKQNAQLLRSAMVTGGEEGVKSYEKLRNKIISLNTEYNNIIKKATQMSSVINLSTEETIKPIKSLDTATQQNFFGNIKTSLQDFGLTSQSATTIVNELSGSITNTTTREQFLADVQERLNRVLRDGGQAFSAQAGQAQELNNKLNSLGSSFGKMGSEMQKTQNMQVAVSGIVSATVAVTGLSNALSKFSDGDTLGGVSKVLTSLGSAGIMLGQINPALAVAGAALTLVGTGVSAFSEHQNKLTEQTKESLATYERSIDALDEYKTKIDGLKSTITDVNASSEDQAKAQKDLLDLQGELIDKYGTEAKGLTDLTKATDAYVSSLKKSEANKVLSGDNVDVIVKKMTALKDWGAGTSAVTDQLTEVNSKIKEVTNSIEEVNFSTDETGMTYFHTIGMDAEDTVGILNNYIDKLRELQHSDDVTPEIYSQAEHLISVVNESLKKAQDTIDDAGESYDEIVRAWMDSTGSYGEKLDLLKVSAQQYMNAMSEGNLQEIQETKKAYEEAINDVKNTMQGEEWEFFSDNDATKAKAISEALEDALSYYDDLINGQKNLNKQIDNGNEKLTDFQGTLEGFTSLSGEMDTLKTQFDDFNETGVVTVDMLTKLSSTFGDTEGFDAFIAVLMDTKSSTEDINQAFEDMSINLIYNSGLLEQITDDNKDWITSELEKKGVMNASAVVTGLLAAKTTSLADETKNLDLENTNTINSENNLADALGITEIASDDASLALYSYYLNKVKTGEIDISSLTIGEANALISMAQALGGAGEQMERWIRLKTILEQISTRSVNGTTVSRNDLAALVRESIAIKKELGDWTPDSIDTSKFFDIKTWQAPEKSSSKKSSSSSSKDTTKTEKEVEAYQVAIDKYQEYTDTLTKLEKQIKDLDTAISNTTDYQEKNKYIEQQISLMKTQQDVQHQLNDARDEEIQQNIKILREKGLEIDYNPDTNELKIKDLEKLNELKSDDQETTNKLIKEYEDLANATIKLNEANQTSSETWKTLQLNQEKSLATMEQNLRSEFQKNVSDKLFNKIFYENLYASEDKIKAIYSDILQDYNKELERQYALGKDKTDSWVQDLITKIQSTQKTINDLDKTVFERQLTNFDTLIGYLGDTANEIQEKILISGQKLIAVENRIAELSKKDIKEVGEELLSLYAKRAAILKEEYEYQKKILEIKKSDYDATISAVTNAIDKEIDKIKEEQAARDKANEAKEKEIELMQLKEALEKAQSQKTIQVYKKDEGFVWEADQDAIKNAQKALDDFYSSNQTDELQERIDALEEYKDEWSKISSDIENAENEIKASETIGTDWQEKLFDAREETLDDFKKNYKNTAEELKKTETEYQEQVKTLAEETEALQKRIEDSADAITDAFAKLGISKGKTYYADSLGNAPKGASAGDIIATSGGTYLIGEEGQEGYTKNEETGLWSKYISAFTASIDDLTGTEIVDNDVLKSISDLLDKEVIDLLEDGNDKTEKNTDKTEDNTKTTKELNKSLDTYSDSIEDAVENTDASAKNSEKSAKRSAEYAASAADSASSAAQSALDAARSASSAADSASDISSSISGSKNHKGLNAAPIGSSSGKESFNKDLLRIANGDLESDELLTLLKKGEAVMTPDQLSNITGALNYSLNTINLLKKMQNATFTAGTLQGINSRQSISNGVNGASFGDINIVMNEVNDVDTFSRVLQTNIKSIFAQTIANR